MEEPCRVCVMEDSFVHPDTLTDGVKGDESVGIVPVGAGHRGFTHPTPCCIAMGDNIQVVERRVHPVNA